MRAGRRENEGDVLNDLPLYHPDLPALDIMCETGLASNTPHGNDQTDLVILSIAAMAIGMSSVVVMENTASQTLARRSDVYWGQDVSAQHVSDGDRVNPTSV